MARADEQVDHVENASLEHVRTAKDDRLSSAPDMEPVQTADLPATMAQDISYGKNGIAGLIGSPYIFGAAFMASLGGFSFGYDMGVIGIINVMPQFHATFPRLADDAANAALWKGLNTGILQAGCFVGCFFMPYLCDRWSRKWAITIMVCFFNIGGIIMTAAPTYEAMAFGRFFGGIGTGTLALGAPLYISEISPPNLRGTLLVLQSISIVSGVVIAYFISYGTRNMDGEIAFRLPFGLQLVASTILGVMIHFFPYSPRWLCLRGRTDDCLKALARLRRLPETDERLYLEREGIMAEVELQRAVERKNHPGKSGISLEILQWSDLFKKKVWRRTVVALGVAWFQQFSGVNAFVYYAPTLFQSLGLDYEMSLIISGVMNVIQLVAVIVCFLVIDIIGRRPLAIWGAILPSICYMTIAGIFATQAPDWNNASAGWAAVVMAFLFMFFYGVSYSPLGWALPSEVYSTTMRSKGVAAATATVWIANTILTVITPPMIETAGFGTYIFYGSWCALAAVWAYFFVPETKGKTLEDMDALLGDNSAAEEKELMKQAASRRKSSSPVQYSQTVIEKV